jgi:hypothetical protein
MQHLDLLLKHLKHLQHIFEISETLEIYASNMRFHRNITLLLGRMDLVVVELETAQRPAVAH